MSNNSVNIMNVKCINCGAIVPHTAKFCQECGSKIEKKQICSNCGAELLDGSKFCVECGTKVETQENIQHIKEVIMESESPIINKIPSDVDLSKSIIDVNYILENIPNTINEISSKVLVYNDKAIKQGYSLLTLNNETKVLKGCFSPKTVEGNSSNYVTGFITGFKHGWKESELRNDFLNICRLCETIAKEYNVKIEEVVTNVEDVSVYSPLVYVNEILPYSDILDKTPNGIQVSDSEFSVLYALNSNSEAIAKALEKVNKYNQRAIKHGYPLFTFNQDTMVLKGEYRPKQESPEMNYFQKLHVAGRNGDLCGDFLKICKLCETIMNKSKN